WDAELANAATIPDLDAVWGLMRAARARTGAREKAYKARRAELAEAEWEPSPAPSADVRDTAKPERTREVASTLVTVPARAGRAPQDHQPPANRAARRAAA